MSKYSHLYRQNKATSKRKRQERIKLAEELKTFLDNDGVITKVPFGETGDKNVKLLGEEGL